MVKAGAMVVKAVVPGIPSNTQKRALLEDDLHRIGCHGFMGKPWNLRVEEMVAELMSKKDNQWHETVRQALEKWTAVKWWRVYRFLRQGKGMASKTDQFIDGKFSARVNPKDGFVVSEYKDDRARQVLEFLVPILYPEKSTRVTMMVGCTIFGALSRERRVDSSLVMRDVV